MAYVDDLLITGTSRDIQHHFCHNFDNLSASNTPQFLHLNNHFDSWGSASVEIPMVTSLSVLSAHTTAACSRTWTSTTTAIPHRHLLCGDLQCKKMRIWIQTDITSTASKVVGMLIWLAQIRPDLRSHSTSCCSNRMGLAAPQSHSHVLQRNRALQVPHFTSATSRSLITSQAVDASSYQHIP